MIAYQVVLITILLAANGGLTERDRVNVGEPIITAPGQVNAGTADKFAALHDICESIKRGREYSYVIPVGFVGAAHRCTTVEVK